MLAESNLVSYQNMYGWILICWIYVMCFLGYRLFIETSSLAVEANNDY